MTTENMQRFMDKNKTNMVVFGEHRTPENTPISNRNDMERADRTLYRFDDGTEFTVTREDTQSAPGFTPNWDL